MICQKCKSMENPEGTRFCLNCGHNMFMKEISQISIGTVLKVITPIGFIMGFIVGIMTYICLVGDIIKWGAIFNIDKAFYLTISGGLWWIFIWMVFIAALFIIASCLFAILYNYFAERLNGIELELNSI